MAGNKRPFMDYSSDDGEEINKLLDEIEELESTQNNINSLFTQTNNTSILPVLNVHNDNDMQDTLTIMTDENYQSLTSTYSNLLSPPSTEINTITNTLATINTINTLDASATIATVNISSSLERKRKNDSLGKITMSLMENQTISQIPKPFFYEQDVDHYDLILDNLNWIYSQYPSNFITLIKDIIPSTCSSSVLSLSNRLQSDSSSISHSSSSSTLFLSSFGSKKKIPLLMGMLKQNHNRKNMFVLVDCQGEIPLLIHDGLWGKFKIRPYSGLFVVVKNASVFRGHLVVTPRNILGIYQNNTL